MNSTNLCEISVSNVNNRVNLILSKTFKIIKIILYVLAGCFLYISFRTANYYWIFCVLSLIFATIFKILQGVFDCSFDYLFVDGTLKFNKIIRSTKRCRVANFDVKEIQRLYLVDSKNYLDKLKIKGVKVKKAVNNFYSDYKIGINYVSNDKEYMLIIKYDSVFLSYILKRLNSRIIDKDLIEFLREKYE